MEIPEIMDIALGIRLIAVNMESMKWCLDFHDSTPVDQGFRH